MDPNEKNEFKEALGKLEIELQQDLEEMKKSSKPVELDQQSVGRVSRIDAIQQQQMALASIQRMEQRLKHVKSALGRLKTEDFGFCLKCEEPIATKRLKARPESPLCLNCSQRG